MKRATHNLDFLLTSMCAGVLLLALTYVVHTGSVLAQNLGLTPLMAEARSVEVLNDATESVQPDGEVYGVSTSKNGYSTFTRSNDTRVIYVSSSQGKDSNSGLSQDAPKKTIAAGRALLRYGKPDWLLLKRGDTWTDEVIGSLTSGNQGGAINGRSANEPVLISSYGNGARPVLKVDKNPFGSFNSTYGGNHIAVVGLDFYAYKRDPKNAAFKGAKAARTNVPQMILQKGYDSFLFEDNRVRLVQLSLTTLYGQGNNAKVRNNIFDGNYGDHHTKKHAQCVLSTAQLNMLVENNVFDTCGWHPGVSGADSNIWNRALYDAKSRGGTVFRNNIVANDASGVQLRQGGDADNNLFLRNPYALILGSNQNNAVDVSGSFTNNVVLDSRNISVSHNDVRQSQGTGVVPISSKTIRGKSGSSLLKNVIISGNIFAHKERGSAGFGAIQTSWGGADGAYTNMKVEDNIIYDWATANGYAMIMNLPGGSGNTVKNNIVQQPTGGRIFSGDGKHIAFSGNVYWSAAGAKSGVMGGQERRVNFSNPNRDISSYMQSTGIGGGYEEFMRRAKLRSKTNNDSRFIAGTVNDYIRAGFDRGSEPVSTAPQTTVVPQTDTAPVLEVVENSIVTADAIVATSELFGPTHSAENLFDGCIAGTGCTTGSGDTNSFWVELDLGARYSLSKARLFGDTAGTWRSQQWSLEYKDTNGTWRSAFTNKDALQSGWVEEPLAVTAQSVRLTVEGAPGIAAVQAMEFALEGTLSAGEAVVAANSIVGIANLSATSENFDSDLPLTNLFDGCLENSNNCSMGTGLGERVWLEFDLGQTYDVSRFALFGDADRNWRSHTWSAQYKTAGGAWQPIFTDSAAAVSGWVSQLASVSADALRIEIDGTPGSGSMQAVELVVEGTPLNQVSAQSVNSIVNMSNLSATSENFDSDLPLANLFDGCLTNANSCSMGTGVGEQVWLEFDLGQSYNLTQAGLFGDTDRNWRSHTWSLQFKNNSGVWETAFTNRSAAVSDWVYEALNVTAEQIRIEINGTPGSGSVQAVELTVSGTPVAASSETVTTANVQSVRSIVTAANIAVTSENFSATHPPANLFDGCFAGDGCTTGTGESSSFWVEFDLKGTYDITTARLFGDTEGTWHSYRWALTYQDASGAWQTAFTDANAFTNGWVRQDLDITSDRVRLIVDGSPQYSRVQAMEFELLGTLSDTTQSVDSVEEPVSEPVSVEVDTTAAPESDASYSEEGITVIGLESGDVVAGNQAVEVVVEGLSDISRVDFYIDNAWVRADQSAPFTLSNNTQGFNFDSLRSGSHELRVFVTGDSVVREATVDFTVGEDSVTAETVYSLGARFFSGSTGNVIVVPHNDTLNLREATVAVSFKADKVDNRAGILSKDANGLGDGGHLSVYIEDGELFVRFQSESNSVTDSVRVSRGTNYHLEISFDGSEMSAALDGTQFMQESIAADWTANDEALRIGALALNEEPGSSSFQEPFDGRISGITISGR